MCYLIKHNFIGIRCHHISILVLVLSLFTIVRFKNEACSTTTGGNGTCYSSSDCSSLGGSISGVCASGFGVCCLCKYLLAIILFTNMLFSNQHYHFLISGHVV